MQVVDQKNIEKRILFYLSKMYSQNIKKGHKYDKLNKCIAIWFIDFDIEHLKPIEKYMSKWNFREEKYANIILTDAMEIYIIELPKVDKYKENSKLDTWVNFINKVGDFDMDKADESIKKAKEVLEEISEDEHEMYLAHLREKYILDQNNLLDTGYERGLEKGLEQGIEQGIERGIEQGLKQGSKQRELEMARDLKNKDVDINIIIEVTKLTKEEIEKL